MGNDLTNVDDLDKEENTQNEFIKYGLISKKYEEKSNEDSYIISPNIKLSEGGRSLEYSLFGIFDGHNSNYISNFLSKNINAFFETKIKDINDNTYKEKIEEVFKEIDENLRKELNKNKDDKNSVDLEINEKEKEFIKNSIKKSEDIPEDYKDFDDKEFEDLLVFKNLFDYNHNFIKNKNNLNYIGSSASLVLINQENIITIELGITKCILLDKNGIIINSKIKEEDTNNIDQNYNKEIIEHKFSNKEEKKRIKKFNKDVDFESLKSNPYLPTSRSFGFFKYKENELLREENQIISCVPDIEKYDKKKVDFILLITGFEINPEYQTLLSEKIKSLDKGKNKDVKYTQVIEELIKNFQKQKEKSKNDIDTPNEKIEKNNFNLYFGKDNLEEENIILNELDENYYNDIVELNKTNKIGGQGNITCILIKLNKDKDINKDEKIKVEKEKEEKEESKTPDEKNKLKEEEKKEENKDNKMEDSKENTKNE
jgi:serine/threonine protein phosphatase PrpC